MAKASPLLGSFHGGEWSPLMEGRVRFDPYGSAMRKCVNGAGLAQGPFSRRGGNKFVVPQRDHSVRGKLIDFEFSALDTFMLSFEQNVARVLKPEGALLRPPVAVTAVVSLSPFVVTVAAGHGILVAEEVFLGGFSAETALFQAYGLATVVAGNNITIAGVSAPAGFVLSGGETLARVFHISTPYAAAKLPNLRHVQSTDTLYLFEQGTRTQVVLRNGTYDWPIRDYKFEDGPYLPVNDTPTVLTPSSMGSAMDPFNAANVFSSGDTVGFEDEDALDPNVFTYWQSNTAQTGHVGYNFGVATPLRGYFLVIPHDNAHADFTYKDFAPLTWVVEGSNDGVNWTTLDAQNEFLIYTRRRTPFFKFKTEPNFSRYRIQVLACQHNANVNPKIAKLDFAPAHSLSQANITFNASSTAGINRGQGFLSTDVGRPMRLKGADGFWRWYTILTVNSPTQIVCRQESEPLTTTDAIQEWRLGAFSDTTGWPSLGYFFEDRLILAGSRDNPDFVAASVVGGYERHSPTDPDGVVTDFNGWTATLNGRKVGAVTWLQGIDGKGLIIGTLNGPFIIRPIDTKGILTPANAKARPISGRKCANMDSVQVDNQILMVPLSRRVVRELVYDYQSEGYRAPSLSLFSSHIGRSRFVKLAYAAEPHSIIWVQREDGSFAGLTYNHEEEVIGWHRHFLGGGGFVEDMAVLPSPDGSTDSLWLQTVRTIGGQQRRFIEVEQPFWKEGDTLDQAWFVDCGFVYEGAPITKVQGLWRLDGATVSVLADGIKVAPQVVAGGSITLPFAAARVVVGFGFDSEGETMRLEAGAADGTAQGKTKRVHKATVRLWDTVGGQIGRPDKMEDIELGKPFDQVGARMEPFTGDHPVDWPEGYDAEGIIAFRQPAENPLPFNVVAIMPQLHTQDG